MATTENTAVEKAKAAVTKTQTEATHSKADQVADFIQRNLAPYVDDLLINRIGRDRWIRVALTAFKSTPKLTECTMISIGQSLLNAATMGLEVNTPAGEAYLVPRYNKHTRQQEATLQIGYQGLLKLVYEAEDVRDVTAHVVREGDEFEYEEGLDKKLRWKAGTTRGEVTGAFALIRTTKGGEYTAYMPVADIEALRKRGGDADFSPWKTDYEMMCCKTVLRRATKYMRRTRALVTAQVVDEQPTDMEVGDGE